MRSRTAGIAAAMVLAFAATGRAQICSDSTVLTHLATDAVERRLFFALTGGGAGNQPWLVELALDPLSARLHPDSLRGERVGASDGPGPYLAAYRCGDGCLQPLEWTGLGWAPLGKPVAAGGGGTVHLTHDAAGRPWLSVHTAGPAPGVVVASAWLLEGANWIDAGRLAVQAVGSPGIRPDPADPRAVLIGTGRFSRDEAPDYWLASLPTLGEGVGGQLLGDAASALYVTHAATLYLSVDGGGSWRRERWAPWPNRRATVQLHRPGVDYWIDLPLSLDRGAPALLWFDDRDRARPRLRLTRRAGGDRWFDDGAFARGEEASIGIEQVVDVGAGSWLLVGPCADGPDGPALIVVRVAGGVADPPESVPVVPGWPE